MNHLLLIAFGVALASSAYADQSTFETWQRSHAIVEQHMERIRQEQMLREQKKQTRLMEREYYERKRQERRAEKRAQ